MVSTEYADLFDSWCTKMCQSALDKINAFPDRIPTSGGYRAPYLQHVDQGQYIRHGTSTWQHDYMTMSLGLAAKLGNAKAAELIQHYGTFQVQRMTTHPVNLATIYAFRDRKPDGNGGWIYAADWAQGLEWTGEIQEYIGQAIAAGEDTQALADIMENDTDHPRAGDLVGYATSPTGYPAWMSAALAFCVDHNLPNADQAWAAYTQRDRVDYSNNAKYNIVPESQ